MNIQFVCLENSTEILSVLAIFLSAFLAYFFSKRRYTFEKHYDRKLETIEDIYGQIISIRQELKRYLWFIAKNNTKSTEERSFELKGVNDKFHEFQNFFWKKEIVLDDFLSEKIEKLIKKYIEISSASSTDLMNEINKWGEVDKYLENLDKLSEFETIQRDIKDEFKKVIQK